MRRTYISPEYKYNKVYGTYNMLEQSSFFGSKMLEIEDMIVISNQSILYYQTFNKEQLDISVENSLPSIVYNSSDDKLQNHRLYKDDSQTPYQLDKNTKWVMDINLNDILSNYLFAILKQYRTFEGVKNTMTIYNDVDFAIKEYIKNNVINRYKLKNIQMFIKYKDIHSQSILRYQNSWNPIINQDSNILKKIQTQTSYNYSTMKVMFTQEQPSDQYSFEYFFDLIFEKI
jgi:hypothetical protein